MITAAAAVAAGAGLLLHRRIRGRLSLWTRLSSFTQTPTLVPHDASRDRATLYVARGGDPAANVDTLLAHLGGIERIVGQNDVVLIKVSAQWWNHGMTNVATVRRMIDRILGRSGFSGEIIVFENVHYRLKDGPGARQA